MKTTGDDKGATQTPTDDKDDLTKQDHSKFDDAQKNDYIDKLKDENARRRIANRKLEEKQTAQAEELDAKLKELDALTEKMTNFEKKEKDDKMKEASDLEKLRDEVKTVTDELKQTKTQLGEYKTTVREKDLQVKDQGRELFVDRLASKLKVAFSSEFERSGLLADLLTKDKDGNFNLNNEEVILKVKEFAKTRKEPPITPEGGPTDRSAETPLSTEIEALLAKKSLTDEDQKRLDELLEIVGGE